MKQVATEAIVLGRIDFGEASRILTLLTKDQGKISALAKGVRRPKSKLAGGVELFTISDIVYLEGKGDIKTLVSAQLKQNFGYIGSDITRSMLAYDVLKYTSLYTESVCEDSYFNLVSTVFGALQDKELDPAVIWLWFGVQLLELSGHAVNVETDANGNQLQAADSFRFDYNNMAFSPSAQGSFVAAHIKVIRLCQQFDAIHIATVHGVTETAKDLQVLILECIKYND